MAEGNISVGQDQLQCPVCLDLLKDPVAIPCGHSYCMSCITGCWNQEDQNGVYSCPQCRQTFSPRPVLGKNTILAEMVEKLNMTPLQADVPAGSGDVECDICTGRKQKAVKSCLVCLESYCQTHFDRHEEFRSGNRHKVMDATGQLQQMICPKHRKQLEIYCRTDHRCICYLCTMDVHKNHNTVTATEERREKQKQLEREQRHNQETIQKKEKDLMELREDVKTHRVSAQKAVEDCERNFSELIRSIERSRSKMTQLIRDQEQAAVSETEKQLVKLKQEIDDLRRRNTELEQLSCTDNDVHFLKNFHRKFFLPFFSFRSLLKHTDASNPPYDDIGKSVSQLKEKLEDLCTDEIEKISERVQNTANSKEELKKMPKLKMPDFEIVGAPPTPTNSWNRPSTPIHATIPTSKVQMKKMPKLVKGKFETIGPPSTESDPWDRTSELNLTPPKIPKFKMPKLRLSNLQRQIPGTDPPHPHPQSQIHGTEPQN